MPFMFFLLKLISPSANDLNLQKMERHFTTYSGSDVRQQNQATIDSAKV
jgi:hypothetical protein